jgi:hypothetical protein
MIVSSVLSVGPSSSMATVRRMRRLPSHLLSPVAPSVPARRPKALFST